MVKIIIGSRNYEINDPVIQLETLQIDLTKAVEWGTEGKLTQEGEIARLFLDIYGHAPYQKTLPDGTVIDIPGKRGIDLRTATFREIKAYLHDNTIKKAESMKQLCRWVASKRSRPSFLTEIDSVDTRLKNEYSKLSNFKDPSLKELGVFGGGVFGNVRLDGSLNQRPLSKKAKKEFNL